METCVTHSAVAAIASCGQCQREFCQECTVHPFGPKKPSMCLGCALAFAGVRHRGAAAPTKVKKPSRFGRKDQGIVAIPVDEEYVFDMNQPFC